MLQLGASRPRRRRRRPRPLVGRRPCRRVGRRRRRALRCTPSVVSAAPTLARSPVKSVSTSSVELTVATATRSAGVICSFTYFVAGVDRPLHVLGLHRADVEEQHDQAAAGQRPSDGIGFVVSRRPRAAGGRAAGIGCGRCGPSVSTRLDVGRADRAPCRRRACRSISSKVNVRICCGLPSSVTSKSCGLEPADDVARPVADDDVDGDERRAADGAERPAPVCCRRLQARRRRRLKAVTVIATSRPSRATSCNLQAHRVFMSEPEPEVELQRDRIGRTDVTWPNVGELTFVSIAAY